MKFVVLLFKVSKSESLKWKEETSDGQAPVEKEKTYQKDPSNAMVDKQDVITSYKYGTTDVPVTSEYIITSFTGNIEYWLIFYF